jgi:pimeloyl-ACP methyl ester carboxylesterase
MHVDMIGSGPRIVLVHGSVAPGWMTWNAQKPLASRFTLVVPVRSGYPPNPPLERIDFEDQAREIRDLLERGDHLVGHSYGGVVSLLAAPDVPLASLTVVEPPAFGVARGHAAVEEFLSPFEAVAPTDPRAYLEFFLPLVGSALRLSDPLPPAIEAGARAAMAERSPHEAVIPLDALAAAEYPKLVVSGGHNAAFEAVCDILEGRLPAYRAVLPGAGHSIPRLGEAFNSLLESFVARAASTRTRGETL